ncbi:unnamed protein product [Closterium sp. NIES-53]
MAEFSGTHFLFKKKPTRRPAFRVDADGWYSRIPPEPPEPPRPPAPPAPLAPPAPPPPSAPPTPPAPPAPPPLGPVSPQLTGNQPVLTLLLPSAFDEYLSEPESNKAQDEYVEVEHFPGGRWGQPVDCPWDESAVGADDDVADAEEASGADGAEGGTEASAGGGAQGGTADDVFPEGVTGDADDDGVEYWSRDRLPEKLPIPTYPPNNRKRPHPSSQKRDARPPSPRHKLTDHKRQGYTTAEKLKWVALMDLAVSVRALARESGIHRKCLTNWKRTAEFLKDVHSARKRMHGHGRASWYRPMELKVYEKLLEWRRKGTAVSVGRLQEWSREFMKLLYPDKKWKGSQRWSERFRRRWNLSVRMKTRVAQKTAAHAALAGDARHHHRGGNGCSLGAYQERGVSEAESDRYVGVHGGRKEAEAVGILQNGWMDSAGVVRWLEEGVKPFLKPRFCRHAKSSMLVLDSYRGHLTEEVKEKLREMNCVPAIIPSGCRAEVQPLDVCINKSFKASVRQQYQRWFEAEGQEQLTAVEVVLRWVSQAWKGVPADLIKHAFLTCGISNQLDGSEDGLAMAHRRSQLTAEVDVDDDIIAYGFFGNCQEPESDEE